MTLKTSIGIEAGGINWVVRRIAISNILPEGLGSAGGIITIVLPGKSANRFAWGVNLIAFSCDFTRRCGRSHRECNGNCRRG